MLAHHAPTPSPSDLLRGLRELTSSTLALFPSLRGLAEGRPSSVIRGIGAEHGYVFERGLACPSSPATQTSSDDITCAVQFYGKVCKGKISDKNSFYFLDSPLFAAAAAALTVKSMLLGLSRRKCAPFGSVIGFDTPSVGAISLAKAPLRHCRKIALARRITTNRSYSLQRSHVSPVDFSFLHIIDGSLRFDEPECDCR